MRSLAITLMLVAGCVPTPPSTSLYPHPWPDERMRRPDGSIDVSGFPAGNGTPLRRQTLEALREADGFGVASGVFFPFENPLDTASLPGLEGSTRGGASVLLVDVDLASPTFGRRAPIDVRFLDDAGPFGGTNLLVALPYPGMPLSPGTLYAAVVTTDVRDLEGAALPADLNARPETDAHREAARALAQLGVPDERIAARAVFRTHDPTLGMRRAVAQAISEEAIRIEPPVLAEEYAEYCVFRSSTFMPVYQEGEPPYESAGGAWAQSADGSLVRQSRTGARVWISVPRRESSRPESAIFVRAGGGGDRPLVDRGRRDAEGISEPGSGIARELAQAGYVGLSVDGPLGGARNLAGWDEQTALFNVANPAALRDNVRQSALELVLFAHALDGFELDTSACAGASPSTVLGGSHVLIAHSTGATIAPLAAAVEARFHAMVLSGAGASWIRQVVHKESPVPLRPIADVLAGYWPHRQLHEHDPLLSAMQWAGELADPMVYGRSLEDRDVLVFQGVLDTYIPPPIANPLAMSMHLDLGGVPLDSGLPHRSALEDLRLAGGVPRSLPHEAERGGLRVTTQHPADGIEDGHEVLFQQPAARRQLRCFLETLALGRPRLVGPAVTSGACGAER